MKRFWANIEGEDVEFSVERVDTRTIKVTRGGETRVLDVVRVDGSRYAVITDNKSHSVNLFNKGDSWQAFIDGTEIHFDLRDERSMRREKAGTGAVNAGGQVVCPMPGKVIDIKIKVGQRVAQGDGLVVVEAMKMQNEFKAGLEGEVKEICVAVGDLVEGGAVMVRIE